MEIRLESFLPVGVRRKIRARAHGTKGAKKAPWGNRKEKAWRKSRAHRRDRTNGRVARRRRGSHERVKRGR